MLIVTCWEGNIPFLPDPWAFFKYTHIEPNDVLASEHLVLGFAKRNTGQDASWYDFPSGKVLFFAKKLIFSAVMTSVHDVIEQHMSKDAWKFLKGEWAGPKTKSSQEEVSEEEPEEEPEGVISIRCWADFFLHLSSELKVKFFIFIF